MKKKTYLDAETWTWAFDVPESSNHILISYAMLSTHSPKKCGGQPADYLTVVDGAEFYWNDLGDKIFVYLPKLDGSQPTEADKEAGVEIPKEA